MLFLVFSLCSPVFAASSLQRACLSIQNLRGRTLGLNMQSFFHKRSSKILLKEFCADLRTNSSCFQTSHCCACSALLWNVTESYNNKILYTSFLCTDLVYCTTPSYTLCTVLRHRMYIHVTTTYHSTKSYYVVLVCSLVATVLVYRCAYNST